MPSDPHLMVLGRVLEALQSLDTHSAQRDRLRPVWGLTVGHVLDVLIPVASQ